MDTIDAVVDVYDCITLVVVVAVVVVEEPFSGKKMNRSANISRVFREISFFSIQ